METLKKCIITRYDEAIEEPPYLTLLLDKVDVLEPEKDGLGQEFAHRLISICNDKGYNFRFYTNSREEEIDYEIVVY